MDRAPTGDEHWARMHEMDQYQKLISHERDFCQQRYKQQAARQNQLHDSKCRKNLDGHCKMFGMKIKKTFRDHFHVMLPPVNSIA